MRARSAWPVALLVALWLAHLVHDEAWLAVDRAPPVNDQASHFRSAVDASFYLSNSDSLLPKRKQAGYETIAAFEAERPFSSHVLVAPAAGFLALVRQTYVSGSYPPLAYLVAAPVVAYAGPDPDVVVLTWAAVFLAALFAGTYRLGRDLGGPWTGLLAAAIVGLYPWVGGLARTVLLDVPVAAMTTLALAALSASRGFADRRGSLAFGLTAGLAMLTKHSAAFFVAGPFLLALAGAWRDPARRANLAAAFVLGLAVAGCYYLPRIPAEVKHFQKIEEGGRVEADLPGSEPASWAFYGISLAEQMGVAGAALAVLALPFLVRGHGRRAVSIGLWIAVPYVFFSAFSNKDLRYTVPYLPAFALATAAGLSAIPWRRARAVAIATALAVLAAAYAHASWGVEAIGVREVVVLEAGGRRINVHVPVDREFVPRTDDWKTAEILDLLEAGGPPEGEVRVWVLAMAEPVTHALQSAEALRRQSYRHGLAAGTFEVEYREPGDPAFVLVPSSYFGNAAERERYASNVRAWEAMRSRYEEVGPVDLPEGRTLTVFRRRP